MREVVATFDDSINILVSVRNDELEGTKELLAANLEVLDELVKWKLDSCGLISSINFRNVMVFERFASKAELGTGDRKNFINVSLNSGIVPSEDGANG